jgi:hypothetical protein
MTLLIRDTLGPLKILICGRHSKHLLKIMSLEGFLYRNLVWLDTHSKAANVFLHSNLADKRTMLDNPREYGIDVLLKSNEL